MNNNNSGLYKFHSGSTTSRSTGTSTTRSSRSTTTRSSRTKSSRRSSRSSSNKSATSYFDTDEMDYTCTTTGNTNSTKEAAANRLLEESQAIRNFAKNIGAICVVLVVAVFGFDLAVLEEFATVLAYNVVAAAILISGVNLATLLYETMATPVPGSPEDEGEAPPLQGLVRRQSSQRSSSGLVFRRSTSKRPPSVSAPTSSSSLSPQKRGSGGLFSGLWPRSKRSSKNQGEADNSSSSSAHQQQQQQSRSKSMQPSSTTKRSKKLSFGRRRGWPSGRLSAGSI